MTIRARFQNHFEAELQREIQAIRASKPKPSPRKTAIRKQRATSENIHLLSYDNTLTEDEVILRDSHEREHVKRYRTF